MKVESRPILPAGLEIPVGDAAEEDTAAEGRRAALDETCGAGDLTLQRCHLSERYVRASESILTPARQTGRVTAKVTITEAGTESMRRACRDIQEDGADVLVKRENGTQCSAAGPGF